MYFDNDAISAILNEDKIAAKEAGEIKTPAVKSASNNCIRNVRSVTHEIEKITDILIRMLAKKDAKNKDISTLEKYKSDVLALKNSVMAMPAETFQKNDKDINKKTMDIFKEFNKKVLYIAQKNKVEEIAKTMMRLPHMIMETLKAFNNYVLININEVDKHAPKAKALDKKEETPKSKNKILHEAKSNNIQSLLGTDSNSKSFMGGMVRGADMAVTYLWNAATLRKVDGSADVRGYAWIHKGYNDSLTHMDTLGKIWQDIEHNNKNPHGQLGLEQFKKFFGSAEFGKTCGAIAAIVAILYVIKKIWNGIKRFLDF